jgi:hypothetical protein
MRNCLACEGDGWVQIAAGYAERVVPDPSSARLESVDAGTQTEMWDRTYARREFAARSVVPCKVCRPELYVRWAGGHLDRGHNESACDSCSGPRPHRRVPETDRRDLE